MYIPGILGVFDRKWANIYFNSAENRCIIFEHLSDAIHSGKSYPSEQLGEADVHSPNVSHREVPTLPSC